MCCEEFGMKMNQGDRKLCKNSSFNQSGLDRRSYLNKSMKLKEKFNQLLGIRIN